MGDSFYEYLLKYWLLTGKKHERYKRMYLESTRGLIARLVQTQGELTFVAESKNGRLVRKMDHLVCFVPGMLALGAQHIPEVRCYRCTHGICSCTPSLPLASLMMPTPVGPHCAKPAMHGISLAI